MLAYIMRLWFRIFNIFASEKLVANVNTSVTPNLTKKYKSLKNFPNKQTKGRRILLIAPKKVKVGSGVNQPILLK